MAKSEPPGQKVTTFIGGSEDVTLPEQKGRDILFVETTFLKNYVDIQFEYVLLYPLHMLVTYNAIERIKGATLSRKRAKIYYFFFF